MIRIAIILTACIAMVVVFTRASDEPAVDSRPRVDNIRFCAPTFDPTLLDDSKAPILEGLGKWNYRVTTSSKKALQYFNQGLALMYGFNHGEAGRSFRAAIRLDSTFAMGYWGLAMILGPNYNAALDPTSLVDINAAVDKAVKYASKTKPNEQAMIAALAKRFPRNDTKDLAPYYEAYAASMKDAYEKFPDDAEVATIYADAMMNLHPWDLWLKDGSPKPWTPEITGLLEKILARWPQHPGAIHYYIHAIEASKQPEKALAYSDYVRDAMPAAGHLVHMPSHIYIRTGDYHKGVIATEMANESDSSYIAQCKVQGVYPLMYYPHNIHFLAACAFFEGNSKKAIETAWTVSRKADRKFLVENITVQHFYVIPYYVMVHFGKWDDILQLRHPGEDLKYPAATWHYARGMAFAAKGNMDKAEQELAALKKFAEDESLRPILIWGINSVLDVIRIAALVLEGEILSHQKKYTEGEALLRQAVEVEDGLMYTEPPDWFFSVRHTLGHWLVQAGKFPEAEEVYKQDLIVYRENGWALRGLYNSLQGQKKNEAAADVQKRFDKAWQWSDIKLVSSRYY